ncbi:MAG TPA: hypothetical protein VNQ77_09630 [Frankiaceae bacterium]|nr:hypothetical protein [Frankiaceae bacterium]
MRVRNAFAALAAASLLAGLTATPATAGTGSSGACSDGVGYREVVVLTSPVTVAVEISYAPNTTHQNVLVCYSTSSPGQPASVTSGAVAVDVWTNTGTAYPGAYVGIGCYPDFVTGVGPECAFANSANLTVGDVAVATPPSSICLVSLGSGCVAYVPGVKVTTGQDATPFVSVQLLGVPVTTDVPKQCIAVVVTCP